MLKVNKFDPPSPMIQKRDPEDEKSGEQPKIHIKQKEETGLAPILIQN